MINHSRAHSFLRVRGRFVAGLFVLGMTCLCTQQSFAGRFTLVDENSSVAFNTDIDDNAFNWNVDGEFQLGHQAFWYRVGNVREQNLNRLPHPVEGTTDTNFDGNEDTLFVRYNGAGFRIDVRYALDGGTAGSRASDITEQISISNLSLAPLDFHFFQYSDFDLQGTSLGDSAVFTNANAVRQFEGALTVTETVITPVPSHREINFFDLIRPRLNDGSPTTLSDTPPTGVVFGPGDVVWAYQWDFTLPVGGTFQISKDKQITGIPEPAGLALLAIAGLMLGLGGQRKRLFR